MNAFKQLFLLDSNTVYLNHGSYGATPSTVFEIYQGLQLQLERDPVDFINNQLPPLLKNARAALGRYLNANADDLVYVPNATFGLNVVAHALPLAPGDEVLTTDHEYGSINNLWSYVCRKRGASYRKQAVAFPVASDEAVIEEIWAGITPQTKVLFLSHITSSTALRLPVEALCKRARAAGIMTVIDGAHAPGQIALDLDMLGADFYIGNCHKWLCSPKGAAFLYTRRERQALIEPLVIGWGWGEERKPSSDSDYIQGLQWLGTNDLSAYLAVPEAIAFQARHDWVHVREDCHRMLATSLERAAELTGLSPLYPQQGRHYEQMAVFDLPHLRDLTAFNTRLYEHYRIQIPCMPWNGRQFLRISVQAYNSQADLDALFAALQQELPAAQH
jgi:isopenicillin-N epimerase